ncbi:hypothetical protein [Mycolicibacterium phlei]
MSAPARLSDAAFGDLPGLWPLPAAATSHDRWLRAVAAGGQGHYAVARTELAILYRSCGPERSLAYSTQASFLRQLGRHTAARSWDGRALAAARTDEARADALIGLAADALGAGRFPASARALERAAGIAAEHPRLRVRFAWVSAELAMAGDQGTAAVEHARRGVEHAEEFGSTRHRVKSSVVLAAAHCSAGDLAAARAVADAALADTDRHGLVPLRWALACLLSEIGSDSHSAHAITAFRDDSADIVRLRGGVWSVR